MNNAIRFLSIGKFILKSLYNFRRSSNDSSLSGDCVFLGEGAFLGGDGAFLGEGSFYSVQLCWL